jgi:MFS superfamily sulfate permease-like transporter
VSEPRAFISFDFDHNSVDKLLFVGQARNSRTPFSVQDWSCKASLPQAEWEAALRSKINACNMLIVLVGNSMANASGVAKEIGMAADQNVPVFGVYVGGANAASTLPAGLARNRVIGWSWDAIAAAISQMMGEGKNR